MDRTPFFNEARALLGGKLTQYQVDRFNELLDEFQGQSLGNKSKTTSPVGSI
ncbi:hypothetical protein F904_01446 [Acinetobacter dispersus]|uniref:Uncharacterized protein n=1 Tax=Acinetobacter dispersus TaxID=70348 RepID=N9LAM0_9GAMM|nr:hypothetical protein F904_01446 [Acinetobacter dispersus]